ncbi:hypothetical protein QQ045_019329 [Rhodiola kirilowii]
MRILVEMWIKKPHFMRKRYEVHEKVVADRGGAKAAVVPGTELQKRKEDVLWVTLHLKNVINSRTQGLCVEEGNVEQGNHKLEQQGVLLVLLM